MLSKGPSKGGLASGDRFTPPGAKALAASTEPPPPHAVVRHGRVVIDGEEKLLFGGELHYFRVRDKHGDVANTHRMWAETMDRMVEAGMNLVSTYVPWDHHNPAEGEYNFAGTRDLGKFMELAAERGLYVVLKPGPNIMGEWPRGFGSYGSAPDWWKRANPDALERLPNRKFFSFHPFADRRERLPAYLAPKFLEATDRWYAAFAQAIRPHVKAGLVAIQLDNETNLYWSDRFNGAGHNEDMLRDHRERLEAKYGTLDALNATYGTAYARFADVTPPWRAPSPGAAPGPGDVEAADWYESGQAAVAKYLTALRGMLEAHGLAEPDVFFTTNDSPFTLALGNRVLKNLLLPDGRKNPIGLAGLDLYPKADFWRRTPQSQPFQADFYTRLFAALANGRTGAGAFASSAELQAGMFSILGPIRMPVPAESTDQLLARSFGRGMTMGALYVMRDGWNADNSRYDYQAPLDRDGAKTRRYEVVERWGRFLRDNASALLGAEEVKNSIGLLVDTSLGVPKAGMKGRPAQLAMTVDNPAIFGWLAHAGLNPEVLDLETASDADLARLKLVVVNRPDVLPEASRQRLERVLDAATMLAFTPDAPAVAEPTISPRAGQEHGGELELPTSTFGGFGSRAYYRARAPRLAASADYARRVASLVDEEPPVTVDRPRALAWASRSLEASFLYVVNDDAKARPIRVDLPRLEPLGLEPDRRYSVVEGLSRRPLGEKSGRELARDGIDVDVARYSTAAVVLRPVS